jgi:hypothetical protein
MSRVTYIFGRDPDKKGPPEKPGVPGNRPGKPTDPNEDGPMTLDPPVEEPGPTSPNPNPNTGSSTGRAIRPGQ